MYQVLPTYCSFTQDVYFREYKFDHDPSDHWSVSMRSVLRAVLTRLIICKSNKNEELIYVIIDR